MIAGREIDAVFTDSLIFSLKAGETVLLSGVIYTARDAAHARLMEIIAAGGEPPFPFAGSAVYYAGPCPARPDCVIGSVGPTTAARMDAYAPALIERGLRVMIGKGRRSPETNAAIRKHGGLYLAAVGGAGALIARCVVSAETVAFADLGTEAVHRLRVRHMPLVVATDACGNDVYSFVR